MNRRDSAAPELEEKPAVETSGKKPVIIYILVLFLVAFLLMTLSLLSHQRSNTEAIGQLQGSLSAMQEVQGLQEQIIALQKDLSEAENRVEELEEQAEYQQSVQETRDRQLEAMSLLYSLQQRYSTQNYEACREIIDRMETDFLWGALNDNQGSPDSVTSPAECYQQLKEALEGLEAEP